MPKRPPSSSRPVTMADIAAHLGVSKAAVSLALRGKPGVSPSEAGRIRKAAERLGYAPNPLIGVHMAHVRNALAPRYQATLGWIDNHPRTPTKAENPGFHEGLAGAKEEASRLGFRLEEFRLHDPGMSPAALVRVLLTRNIAGLIVAPQPRPGAVLDLEWRHFSAVTLGYSLGSPNLHRISNCQRDTLHGALSRLRDLGYPKIGTVINEEGNERVNRAWTSAFWDDYQKQPVRNRIAPLLFHPERRPLTPAMFVEWFRRKRPDALLAEDHLDPILKGLGSLGLKPGRDIALAVRSAVTGDSTYAGMNQNAWAVGRAAVAFLVGMIQRNERGVPDMPQQLLINSTWQSGASVDERGPGKERKLKV